MLIYGPYEGHSVASDKTTLNSNPSHQLLSYFLTSEVVICYWHLSIREAFRTIMLSSVMLHCRGQTSIIICTVAPSGIRYRSFSWHQNCCDLSGHRQGTSVGVLWNLVLGHPLQFQEWQSSIHHCLSCHECAMLYWNLFTLTKSLVRDVTKTNLVPTF